MAEPSSTLEKYNKLEALSVDALTDYVAGGGGDKAQTQVARMSVSVLSLIGRQRALALNTQRFQFQMAKSLTSDPVKLAEYIAASQPSSKFTRLLAAGSPEPKPEGGAEYRRTT